MQPKRYDTGTAMDHPAVSLLWQHGFASATQYLPDYFRLIGAANLRVVRAGPTVCGAATLLPMGQYFGGRSVPTTGVASVAVAPEHQRQGVATELMRGIVRELAAAKVPLCTLYASTLPLYRKVGFEVAGCHYLAELRPNDVQVERLPETRGGSIERVTGQNEMRVRALYGAHAPSHNGHLDRSDAMWTRLIHAWAGQTRHVMLVVGEDGQTEGYLSYVKQREESPFHSLLIKDLHAISAWGYRRLWSFVGDLCTHVVSGVRFPTAPHDPALLALADPHFPVTLTDNWMLRVTHVSEAFARRGYPPGLSAELDLDIYDDIVDGNNGPWRLVVRHGRGAVERGGSGAFRVDARGLGGLYSGFMDPQTLALLGRAHATPAALAVAGSIFGGPQPWMRETF